MVEKLYFPLDVPSKQAVQLQILGHDTMTPDESVFAIADCLEALTVALIDGCNVSLEELSSIAGFVWDDAIASATLDDGVTVVALGHLKLPTSIAHLGSRIKRWKRLNFGTEEHFAVFCGNVFSSVFHLTVFNFYHFQKITKITLL